MVEKEKVRYSVGIFCSIWWWSLSKIRTDEYGALLYINANVYVVLFWEVQVFADIFDNVVNSWYFASSFVMSTENKSARSKSNNTRRYLIWSGSFKNIDDHLSGEVLSTNFIWQSITLLLSSKNNIIE